MKNDGAGMQKSINLGRRYPAPFSMFNLAPMKSNFVHRTFCKFAELHSRQFCKLPSPPKGALQPQLGYNRTLARDVPINSHY